MPRKGYIPKRELIPDYKFNNKLVSQLINQVLRKGEKSFAEKIVYEALDVAKEKSGTEPLNALKKALNNVKPLLEVKPRRVGGATYQVPVEVPSRRGVTLALRWIVGFARARKGDMSDNLAAELVDAIQGTGSAVKKKEDLHKMAEANRAFAHYRW
ncbi:MAG TPA: 30S ribosomal protein S7 [Candidatus Subteraquimicrobiales bacterium]